MYSIIIQKCCFWPLNFIKIAFRAPSLKSKCQTLGVTISWLVGAGVWGIYTWVLSNWLGKLNAWQDFLIMGPTCPAWLLGLAGYCWALSPMGIFSLFLLGKIVAPSLSLSYYYYYLGGVSVSWLVGAGVGESIHELNVDGMILIFTWFTSLLNFWRGVVTREMLQGPFIIHDVGLENLIILTFSAILQLRLARC